MFFCSTTGDCWVDYIEWTRDVPESGGDWSLIEYTYDPAGRRIAKDVDGAVTKYEFSSIQGGRGIPGRHFGTHISY